MTAFSDFRNTEKTIHNDMKWELASRALRAAADMAEDRIALPGETEKQAEKRHEKERRDAALRKAVNIVGAAAILCGVIGGLISWYHDIKEEEEEQNRQDRLDLYRRMSIRKGR